MGLVQIWFNHQPGEYVIPGCLARTTLWPFSSCQLSELFNEQSLVPNGCPFFGVSPRWRGCFFLYGLKGSNIVEGCSTEASLPISSMGRTGDLPIHEWLLFMVNVGKYTSPMDGMGYRQSGGFYYILFASIKLGRWLQEFDKHVCLNRLKLTT